MKYIHHRDSEEIDRLSTVSTFEKRLHFKVTNVTSRCNNHDSSPGLFIIINYTKLQKQCFAYEVIYKTYFKLYVHARKGWSVPNIELGI